MRNAGWFKRGARRTTLRPINFVVAFTVLLAAGATASEPPSPAPADVEALRSAVLGCDSAALRPLLAAKPTFAVKTYDESLLVKAVVLCPAEVSTLLTRAGHPLEPANEADISPLAMAVTTDKPAHVDALLAAGANANRATLRSTPLALAIAGHNPVIIVALAKAGARFEDPAVTLALKRAPPAVATLAASCAAKKATCDVASVVGAMPPTPAVGWWKAATACAAPAALQRTTSVVRCTCGGGSHGAYSELYPGTEMPLASGNYLLHQRHGVWTKYGADGKALTRSTWANGNLLREEVLAADNAPPVYPGEFLSNAELALMKSACTSKR